MCSAEGAGRAFSVVEKPQGKSFTDFLQPFCEGAVNSLCMPSSGHTFCRVTMEKRCRLQVKMSLICRSLSLSLLLNIHKLYCIYYTCNSIVCLLPDCVCTTSGVPDFPAVARACLVMPGFPRFRDSCRLWGTVG